MIEELLIPLEEIKLFLRVDYVEDDLNITRIFKAATRQAENFINKIIQKKDYNINLYNSNREKIFLPFSPIFTINELKIEGVVFSENDFTFDDEAIFLKNSSVMFKNISVDYTAGFAKVEDDLIHAILVHTARLYEDKTGYSKIPSASFNIYKNYKKIRL